MSKRIEHGNPKLKLRLNISSSSASSVHIVSPDSSSSSSSSAVKADSTDSASRTSTMDDSSCLSSEPEDAEIKSFTKKNSGVVGSSLNNNNNNNKENELTGNGDEGMVLVGCPRCLMYVILSEVNLKCPICKTSVLQLDLLSEVKNWSTK